MPNPIKDVETSLILQKIIDVLLELEAIAQLAAAAILGLRFE